MKLLIQTIANRFGYFIIENLRFQRLLAQEPMKFANLVLQSPIVGSRHDLFPAGRRRSGCLAPPADAR